MCVALRAAEMRIIDSPAAPAACSPRCAAWAAHGRWAGRRCSRCSVPGLLVDGIIASVCAAAIYDDIHCGMEVVEEKRQDGGPCVNTVMITGPITGPDGRPYDHSNVMIDVYRCPF